MGRWIDGAGPLVTGGVAFERPPVLALPNAARAEDD
jgi:hypothetical protein